MIRSRALGYLVGVATAWVPLYIAGFVVVVTVLTFTLPVGQEDEGVPGWFVGLFVAHGLTMLVVVGLLVLYLVDLFKNPSLPEGADGRILWLVLILVVGPFSMPVYWWQHLRPGSVSFARRTSAVTT